MARVTVEDAVKQVGNRLTWCWSPPRRAQIKSRYKARSLVDEENDKPTVIALRDRTGSGQQPGDGYSGPLRKQQEQEAAELAAVAAIAEGRG